MEKTTVFRSEITKKIFETELECLQDEYENMDNDIKKDVAMMLKKDYSNVILDDYRNSMPDDLATFLLNMIINKQDLIKNLFIILDAKKEKGKELNNYIKSNTHTIKETK